MPLGEENPPPAEVKSALENFAERKGIINLAKMIEGDSFLCRVTVELLDSLIRWDAEKHFRAVDTLWRNNIFFELLCQEFHNNRIVNDLTFRTNETRHDLFELRGKDVKKDPELKAVLETKDPAARMRGALSILIGYWCLEYKLEDYFTGDLGLYGLGIETISFSNEDSKMFTNTAEKRAGDPNASANRIAKSKSSTIGQLINVPSISRLAEKIINNYPGIVGVAEELLKSLENVQPSSLRLLNGHRVAVREFWRNKDFCELLLRQILEDPCMLAIVKIFSYRSTREIALLHTEFILQQLVSESFFTKLKSKEENIRLALAILFEHWTCMGVLMKARKATGHCYSHRETTKMYAEFKCNPIFVLTFWPCVGAGVHNDPAAYERTELSDLLTRWNEEDQTEINHLLGKDLSYVLTCEYNADETMINGLLEKFSSVRADSRMRLVLTNVPGTCNLALSCCF